MKAYILIFLIVLCFTSGGTYWEPDLLDFDEALEKIRGGEIVEELDISSGRDDYCISPKKYPYLIEFRELKSLAIAGCGLKLVPPEVFELKNLEYLNLGGNQLKEIPEGIGKLTKLKELLLQGNQISKLPESIGQLMNLKELNLANNNLTTLPSSIVNLINLRESISLVQNKFKTIHLKKFNTDTNIPSIYPRVYSNTRPVHLKANLEGFQFYIEHYVEGNPRVPLVYTVTATSGLSVRNKPKLNAKKIDSMPHKLKIAVYEESSKKETIDGITAPWMRIKAIANGKYMEGWAWGGYLEVYKYEEDYPSRFQDMVNEVESEIGNSNLTLDTKQIQFFIKNGVDINTKSDNGQNEWTLLNSVAYAGNIQDFRFLLANGADAQIKSGYGMSVARSVVVRKDIGIKSKKTFLLVLQDYGYNFKLETKYFLMYGIYSSFKCGVTIEEVEEEGSELLDFLKEKLDIKHISEILNDGDLRSYCDL